MLNQGQHESSDSAQESLGQSDEQRPRLGSEPHPRMMQASSRFDESPKDGGANSEPDAGMPNSGGPHHGPPSDRDQESQIGEPGNEQEGTDPMRHPLNWPVSTTAPVQSRSFLAPVRFILPVAAIIGFLALGKIPDFRATVSWFMGQPSGSSEQSAVELPLGSSLGGVSNGITIL